MEDKYKNASNDKPEISKEDIDRINEQLSKINNAPNYTIMTCSCLKLDDSITWEDACKICPSMLKVKQENEKVTTRGGTY